MSTTVLELSKNTFTKYATHLTSSNDPVMSIEDFVNAIAPANEDYHKISRNSYASLFQVADRTQKGYITYPEWSDFVQLLGQPDAEYRIAFDIFSQVSKSDAQPRQDGRQAVDFDKFVQLFESHKSPDALPFSWEGSWANLYVGEAPHRHDLPYNLFCQMVSGLMGERVRQAFLYYDTTKSGFIKPEQFGTIITKTAAHKLSDTLLGSLHTLCDVSNTSRVSYATVRAFLNILRQADMVDLIAQNATKQTKDGKISSADFIAEAARSTRFSLFTPLEIDILFHFASINADDADQKKNQNVDNCHRRLSLNDFRKVFDPLWQDPRELYQASQIRKFAAAKNAHTDPKRFLGSVFESVYNFALGSVAGAFGATVVYPIDLVKTRMQNQRKTTPGQPTLYKNSLDCFRKVVAREGFRGLYSGLGPQLIGVAPEKAIKLTVNDLVRGMAANDAGHIPLHSEILAGGTAGACQVVFTNPLEIVKIRLQIQGAQVKGNTMMSASAATATSSAPRQSAVSIVRSLGLLGLYKGASACLLRDVPFSAIYFPTYAHLKKDFFGEGPNKKLTTWQLLTAGAIAGMPAAYLTTPFDVIKTRLQVEAKQGESSYRGLRHAATTILKEEGFAAFFKGGPARILRSSPQFGCTLAAYEFLHEFVPYNNHPKLEAGHAVPSSEGTDVDHPFQYLRSRNALKILLDIDDNFGKPGLLTAERAKLIPGLKALN
ncbi:mitochondrial carrier [Nadsonia fulvescens var. elongata DSM 6958]|uniref:Mitochondrial aspartate-glutamate transporter AGC1 n=1 Tax=Nadsonia fulvescens var. elongata DSM 6958 TaxID=857566 RepID=A0A1E3PKJ6_9ASCO|nr:mitochondrial carrier [Nadsonia fulvescens var. elongata DSM 6958]